MVSVVCILDRLGRCRGPNSGERCIILDRSGRCRGPNTKRCMYPCNLCLRHMSLKTRIGLLVQQFRNVLLMTSVRLHKANSNHRDVMVVFCGFFLQERIFQIYIT